MDFVPTYEFRLFVDRYHDNYKVKSFSRWDQFLCLAFARAFGANLVRPPRIELGLRVPETLVISLSLRAR
jgi:Domain of unknown function (DUF4372)